MGLRKLGRHCMLALSRYPAATAERIGREDGGTLGRDRNRDGGRTTAAIWGRWGFLDVEAGGVEGAYVAHARVAAGTWCEALKR